MTSKLKPYIHPNKKKSYYTKDMYFCTCDLNQKDKYKLAGTDIEIIIRNDLKLDHREAHPNVGVIVSANDSAQFKVGQQVLCKHFTFQTHDRQSKHFTKEGSELIYKVTNLDIMFGIDGEELIPREGVLLCEGIEGKFTDTVIELGTEYEGRRRDIVRVLKVWEGCTEYKVGDLLMVKNGGDYPFEFRGKKFIKVDHYFDDVYAITDTTDTYDVEIRKHTNHGKQVHT